MDLIIDLIIDLMDLIFIIKELPEKFEGQFTCFRENTEKHITLSILIKKKVTRIDKKRKRNRKNHYLTD